MARGLIGALDGGAKSLGITAGDTRNPKWPKGRRPHQWVLMKGLFPDVHQWKRKKLMTVYGTATSLYTLARITSGHAYLPLAYILTYTIIYYIHLYHITIKLSPTYKNGHNLTNIMYNTLHIIKCIYKLLQPGALSGQPLGYCNPMWHSILESRSPHKHLRTDPRLRCSLPRPFSAVCL